jgi:hypothetical protein
MGGYGVGVFFFSKLKSTNIPPGWAGDSKTAFPKDQPGIPWDPFEAERRGFNCGGFMKLAALGGCFILLKT